MVRKRRVNNKSVLEGRDELLSEPTGFRDFAEKNFAYILAGVAVIVVVIVGSLVWGYIADKRETSAADRFSRSVAFYEQVFAEDGSIAGALEQFESIINEYGGTGSGTLSLFYAGNCHYALGDYDQAIKRYERFLKTAPKETHLTILAYDSLGYCYEEKGDYLKAIEYFEKTVDSAPGLGEMGLLNLARCYEALEDTENSLKYYQRVVLEYPGSQKATYVQEKIEKMEGAGEVGESTTDAAAGPEEAGGERVED